MISPFSTVSCYMSTCRYSGRRLAFLFALLIAPLCASAGAAIIEFPLDCPRQFECGQSWSCDFDLGVSFSRIDKVYIEWSGGITAELVNTDDPLQPTAPADARFFAVLSGRFELAPELFYTEELACLFFDAGGQTYPAPDRFKVISQFDEINYAPNEFVARFAPDAYGIIPSVDRQNEILASYGGGTVTHTFSILPGVSVIEIPPGATVPEVIAVLENAPEFIYVEPNYIISIPEIDPSMWIYLLQGKGSVTITFGKKGYRSPLITTAQEPQARLRSAKLVVEGRLTTEHVTLNVPSQYPTIQDAILDAFNGDTVLVADGAYTGDGNTNIELLGKALTVRSENGPDHCVIDCNGSEYYPRTAFACMASEDANCVIEGFTITNAYASGKQGAISCMAACPTIKNCVITHNSAIGIYSEMYPHSRKYKMTVSNCTISNNTGSAVKIDYVGYGEPVLTLQLLDCQITGNFSQDEPAGVFCQNAILYASNCTFADNVANRAGGIDCCDGSVATITNCTFTNGSGSAIRCEYSSADISNCSITGIYGTEPYHACPAIWLEDTPAVSSVTNCLIADNYSNRWAAGIWCTRADALISNCTIVNNFSEEPGGGIGCYDSCPVVTNCIIRGNQSPSGPQIVAHQNSCPSFAYCNIAGAPDALLADDTSSATFGVGNIDLDPLFKDALAGDFHILPDSPCIDSGDPTCTPSPDETDLDGNPRISAGRIDMGAYESLCLEAQLMLYPQTLNRQAKGPKDITAIVSLPEYVTPDQFDQDSVLSLMPANIQAHTLNVIAIPGGKHKGVHIFASFNRQELLNAIPQNGKMEVAVSGRLTTGLPFSATDSLTVKGAPRAPTP